MADVTALRQSPLAHLHERMRAATVFGAHDVLLAERPFVTMVNLRVNPDLPAATALASVVGVQLPRACGETAEHGPHAVLWLGPDEWLVVSQAEAGSLTQELAMAADGAHVSVVDVSANRTVLELSGAFARAVLEKGCPVDLHPTAFRPGMAVATTLARIPVVLWQVGPASYRLLPRSSFADYVARWLLDAMDEFAHLEVR